MSKTKSQTTSNNTTSSTRSNTNRATITNNTLLFRFAHRVFAQVLKVNVVCEMKVKNVQYLHTMQSCCHLRICHSHDCMSYTSCM
jgi:hypothetical protein